MTKPKIVTLKTVAFWQPIVAAAIDGLLREPPRTNGTGERAKIRLKMKIGQKHFQKLPKCVMVPCEEDGMEIREWRCCTLLDFLHLWGISPFNTSMIYKRRSGLLLSMALLENSIDECMI